MHFGLKWDCLASYLSSYSCSRLQYLGLMLSSLENYNLTDGSSLINHTADITDEAKLRLQCLLQR